MKDLVLAEIFYNASAAHIAQDILRENGIESTLSNENSAQVLGTIEGIGGIRLYVMDDQLLKAQELIKEMDLT
jgi:hypothetical protein